MVPRQPMLEQIFCQRKTIRCQEHGKDETYNRLNSAAGKRILYTTPQRNEWSREENTKTYNTNIVLAAGKWIIKPEFSGVGTVSGGISSLFEEDEHATKTGEWESGNSNWPGNTAAAVAFTNKARHRDDGFLILRLPSDYCTHIAGVEVIGGEWCEVIVERGVIGWSSDGYNDGNDEECGSGW